MTDSTALAKVARRSSTNHGVTSRDDAIGDGLSAGAIARLVRQGHWVRLYQRAYVLGGAPITWKTHLAAIAASLGDRFAFSHGTAGALYELDGVPDNLLEIVTPRSVTLPGVDVHRIRGRFPRTVRIEGFPVTACDRTTMDLFMSLPRVSAELALEDALRRRLTTMDRLWKQYAELGRSGRNGCKAFRRALLERDDRDGTLASRMETKLRRILKTIPGSAADTQFPVDGGRYRIDFAYPDIKLGIEAQSIRWHMGEARFTYDLKRDRHLKELGWTMHYYSWDDLMRPASIEGEILRWRRRLSTTLV